MISVDLNRSLLKFSVNQALIRVLMFCIPTLSVAQQNCSDFVGEKVTLTSLDALTNGVANVRPKSEFETQAQYEVRIKNEIGTLGERNIIVSKIPEDSKYFEYKADESAFYVKSYAFDNTTFNTRKALEQVDLGILKPGFFNVDVVLDRNDQPVGHYSAGNAMGATVSVARIKRTSVVIYDQPETGKILLFPQAKKDPYYVGKFNMAPDAAQRAKPNLKVGFALTLKSPYGLSGEFKPYQATIRNPQDVSESYTIIFANIKCGFVLGENDIVLGSFPTVLSKK